MTGRSYICALLRSGTGVLGGQKTTLRCRGTYERVVLRNLRHETSSASLGVLQKSPQQRCFSATVRITLRFAREPSLCGFVLSVEATAMTYARSRRRAFAAFTAHRPAWHALVYIRNMEQRREMLY